MYESSKQERRRFDRAARKVGDWTREKFELKLRQQPDDSTAAALLVMRHRYHLQEFFDDLIAPVLALAGRVSESNKLDRVIYSLPLDRWDDDQRDPVQQLVMTGRGIGKTTRARVRRLHAMLYNLTALSVALARTEGDSRRWVTSTQRWITISQRRGLPLAAVWPEVRHESRLAPQAQLIVTTRFGVSRLVSGTWSGSLRGLNLDDLRPDSVDLDDIEGEESVKTRKARDDTQSTILEKVLPLGRTGTGMQIIWCQTPVHDDAVAMRIVKRHPELRGWDHVALPVIAKWPDRMDLWAELEAEYFDVDREPSRANRHRSVLAKYKADQERLDAGAQVLDATQMGVMACFVKLWSVGPTAFAREYEMRRTSDAKTFMPESWPRFILTDDDHGLRAESPAGIATHLRHVEMRAHLDPSDGGDPASLAITAMIGGRVVVVGGKVWEGSQLSHVVSELPEILRPFVNAGLGDLGWEPPSGAASVVRDAMRKALAEAGVEIRLVELKTSENKNQRIVNTLEPLATHGMLGVANTIPQRVLIVAGEFDPRTRDNRDDWLDSVQRCAEGHIKVKDTSEEDYWGELEDFA
jgi:hypothetical protein